MIGLCVLVLSFFSVSLIGADWVQVNRDSGGTFRDAVYGGGTFVAVGDVGLIWTSPDGLAWTQRLSGSTGNFYEVTYGAGVYVAVGYHGQIYSSSNGSSWTERRAMAPNGDSLSTVGYNGIDKFIAGGVNGLWLTSPDGLTWTEQSVRFTNSQLDGMCYGNGIWVAAGSSGRIYRSTNNGVTWNSCKTSTGVNNHGAAFADGVFVVGGGANSLSEVWYSTGGDTFIKGKHQATNYFMDFAYDSQHFISCGNSDGYGCSNLMVSTAADGINWVRDRTPDYSSLIGVASSGTRSIAVGARRLIITNTPDKTGEGKGCSGTSGPYITVTAPKSGGYVKRGTTYTITWASSGVTDNVRIKLSTDGGNNYTVIGDNLANSGAWDWVVAANETKSSNCYIRINAYSKDGTPIGIGGPFTIGDTAPTPGGYIRVDAPTAGETLRGNVPYTIRWTSSNVTDNLRMRLSTDGGTTYGSPFADNVPNTGSYTWLVPNSIDSSTCKIKIYAYNKDGVPYDFNNGLFSIVSGGVVPALTFTNPKSGEKVGGGSMYNIRWTSSVKFDYVVIEYHSSTGGYTSITTNAPDTGTYAWSVPNTTDNASRIWMKGYSTTNGNDTEYSDYFKVVQLNGQISITYPNGGESWPQNSKQTITWTNSGTVGSNVDIYYSTNTGTSWYTVVNGAPNNGSFQWTVPPGVKSDTCLIKVSDSSNSILADYSNNIFSMGGYKEIKLNKSKMNFAFVSGGSTPCSQTVFTANDGSGVLNWTASADSSWIKLSPSTGNGDAFITVSIDPTGLTTGTLNGNITITETSAINSPQTIAVKLQVIESTQDAAPIGVFATPENGTTGVTGSIAVTGWALDDVCLDGVKIYREVNGGDSLIGDVVFIEGARPDVELAYPDYPNNTRAGWGYMLLTNMLPDGQTVLKAIATDKAGHQTVLGTKTIVLDNTHAVKPFGAIDSPTQGGESSGKNYRNGGWVLAPLPYAIPTSGSTISVFIDGVFVSKAKYNAYRSDIASLFPGLANSNGAMAYYDFDTTKYKNGVHSIAWGVLDSASPAHESGIGSRYFLVLNPVSVSTSADDSQNEQNAQDSQGEGLVSLSMMPIVDSTGYIDVVEGFSQNVELKRLYPDENGIIQVQMSELARVQVSLDSIDMNEISIIPDEKTGKSSDISTKNVARYSGYMKVADEWRPLPVGSKIDPVSGVFYWQAGPGFVGDYDLVFFVKRNSFVEKKQVHVKIDSKSVVLEERQ